MTEKIIIIGSGPAGYTAAIYAARAGLNPLMVEGIQVGGQLMITTEVENFPGFPKGIQGPDLMVAMREQAERFKTRFVSGNVDKVEISCKPYKVYIGHQVFESETIIISTGAEARWLGLENEHKLRGKGVSACATCDGFFFKNQDVVVVGGGDTAFEEALYLANFAKSVKLIHRRDKFRASRAMTERAKANKKISFELDSTLEDILGVSENKVTGVILKDVKTGKTRELKCDGVFIAIGHKPNTDIFKGWVKMDDSGYVMTEKGSTKTSVPGIFAAGDVADPTYRQAIVAAGTGCMAVIDAQKYLGM